MKLENALLPAPVFRRHMLRYGGFAALMITGSLGLGVLGYHFLASLSWVDAILNASMILAGMGPMDTLHSTRAKLFASAYAIFSGVAFLTSVSVFLAPIAHRILHRFHLDAEEETRRRS